jgi:hypothetical protein
MLQKSLSNVALGIALLVIPLAAADDSLRAHAQQIPPAVDIAAQVRTQGYPCEGDASALKLTRQSWPDEPLWILTCTNATYRVRLIPDMAARIERVQ